MSTARSTRRWSWRIGRIAGIDVYVDATFPLLFLWIASSALGGASFRTVLATVALTVAVFAIVVLQDCGRALMARRYGIRTGEITLLPIGGIARLERIPREPRQELVTARTGSLPVLNSDLVGVVTTEVLSEFLSLGAAAAANGHLRG
jgi:Zn-dependent protease